MRKVIYIAGPLTAKTEADRLANVREAIRVGGLVLAEDAAPYVPHLNHLIPEDQKAGMTWQDYMAWDLPILHRCDGLIRLPGPSAGATVEAVAAEEFGLPVLYWPAVSTDEGAMLRDWLRKVRPARGIVR